MSEMPDFIREAIRAQGKFDPDEIADRAGRVIESGVLDDPEEAEPVQTALDGEGAAREAPSGGAVPLLDEFGFPAIPDERLAARHSDPPESHKASAEVEEQEGSTGKFTPGTHKHRILRVYADAERPLTDTEAWTRAGIGARSGAWHRCSDLLDAGAIHRTGTAADAETGKDVRLCSITTVGRDILKRLDAGRTVG